MFALETLVSCTKPEVYDAGPNAKYAAEKFGTRKRDVEIGFYHLDVIANRWFWCALKLSGEVGSASNSSTMRRVKGKRKVSHTAWLMISAGNR